MKIFISTTSFAEYDKSYIELCREKGFDVIFNPYKRKIRPHELVELAKDVVGLIAGTEPLTEAVLCKLTNLKVISRCGTGLDNIDMEAAARLGIKVYNTPDAPTLPVAELTVGLIIDLLRKISVMDRVMRSGKWEKLMGNLLFGKKVGIIGFGRIGKKVAELLSPFGVTVAFYDICEQDYTPSLSFKGLRDLLPWADIISLHCSASEGRKPVIGNEELKLMKRGSYLINVSRGGIVDENALYNYLKGGHLAGAAVDVFESEPYQGKLLELDNIILTPHIGSYAKESRVHMEIEAVSNMIKGLLS